MEFIKSRIFTTDPRDEQVWKLVTEVPEVSKIWAGIILVLNVAVPGMSLSLIQFW